MVLLETRNIMKTYNGTLIDKMHLEKKNSVLNGINLSVDEGECISIMGKSGSGKTTLLKILGTIDRASYGEVFYNGNNIKKYSDSDISKLRRRSIGFVFQDYNLFDNLTVEENILVPMILDNVEVGKMQNEVQKNAELLNIESILKKYPYEISGGEKQRVAIARALVNDPQIILADEPTGNLDVASTKIIMDYLFEVNKKKGKAIVVVTHDPIVASYGSKVYFIKDGIIVNMIENNEKKEENIKKILDIMMKL